MNISLNNTEYVPKVKEFLELANSVNLDKNIYTLKNHCGGGKTTASLIILNRLLDKYSKDCKKTNLIFSFTESPISYINENILNRLGLPKLDAKFKETYNLNTVTNLEEKKAIDESNSMTTIDLYVEIALFLVKNQRNIILIDYLNSSHVEKLNKTFKLLQEYSENQTEIIFISTYGISVREDFDIEVN